MFNKIRLAIARFIAPFPPVKIHTVDLAGQFPSNQTTSLGAVWVAPGKGSTWRELRVVFGYTPQKANGSLVYGYASTLDMATPQEANQHTNLKLTGSPIQPYDRQRWESGNVE